MIATAARTLVRRAFAELCGHFNEAGRFVSREKDVSMGADARRMMLAAGAIAIAISVGCEKKAAPAAAPPTEVYVTEVVQKDVPEYLELVGQTLGSQDTELRARVEGVLESMHFQEGSFVKQGTLLYQIDRKPLEAALAQAKADQSTAEARLEKANNDVERYKPLAAKQAVSKQELDDALAAQDASRSQVAAMKAAVDKASLDLGYTRIAAPITGLVGTTLVKPGNLVGRGENTLLTTISKIDPILFRVGATEADYLRVARRNPSRSGQPPRAAGIQLILTDGTVHPSTGHIVTVDRAVDPTTGTLGIQIEFPNPNQLLRPGQYGRARILLDTKPNALLVPQRAVQELQNLYSVAVVDAQNKVGFRNVKVGQKVDSLWVIEDGLKPGERVVVEGLQRVRDGLTVNAKPAPETPAKGEAAPGAKAEK
ncbi:MAG TPA: efflux RND transporter periplasmic adaptor subunit [Vicinamibacterales bacterium]